MSSRNIRADSGRSIFPPRPRGMKGRSGELRTLVDGVHTTQVAEVEVLQQLVAQDQAVVDQEVEDMVVQDKHHLLQVHP